MLRTRAPERPGLPPSLLLLGSMLSLQLGAAWGKDLFALMGVGATVWLRLALGSAVLLAWWRPEVRGLNRQAWWAVLRLGVALSSMTFCFYNSIAFLPLGLAVALEFTGPLALALFGSRRPLDAVWALLAGLGVALLSPLAGANLDPRGLAWVAGAAVSWAAYILMSARVGQRFSGGQGLALALGVGALCLSPFALHAGQVLLASSAWPTLVLDSVMMALLASAIPFSLEMAALRRLPTHVFSVLLSLEPAIAALVGFLVLRETLSILQLCAIVLVVAASGGSSWLHARKG